MFYIAVDPGKVSGVAVWAYGKCVGYEVPARMTGQAVLDLTRGSREDLWEGAIERYTITSGPKSNEPDALKVSGALEYVFDTQSIPFHYYNPATCKRMCVNATLRELDWWQPTKDGHANDAKRVLLTHIANRDPELFGQLTGI